MTKTILTRAIRTLPAFAASLVLVGFSDEPTRGRAGRRWPLAAAGDRVRGTVEPVDSRLGDRPRNRRRGRADGRRRCGVGDRQPQRRLLQGHGHRQAAQRELAGDGIRGQPAGGVEPTGAADGRRRLRRHAGDGPDGLHAATGERGQPAEAGLRDAWHRRWPQVIRGLRRQLRDGRRGPAELRQGVGQEGPRRRDGRSSGRPTAARPSASTSSAARRAATRRSTRLRATRATTTASSPTTRRTT